MILARHDNPRTVGPGQYAPIHWRVASTFAVHIFAVVGCPTCHRQLSIASRRHRVAPDGTLSPSLVCPHACAFHEFVRFADWVPGEGDPQPQAQARA